MSTNQIPYYFHNFSSTIVAALNGRPLATSDFSSSGGVTTAITGHSYAFGSNIGYTSSSCILGYWPQGTATCPHATLSTLNFALKPAPEISNGDHF